MMNDRPILSICIPTYNHEKYIVQALDSVFMQKTNYPYEVLVGEDCSTDNTRVILKTYEKDHDYSNLFIFYRETNMSKQEVFNAADLRLKARGKYLITLEGDDYWIDENKIQTQIEFLETHPEYIAVAHNCTVVDEDSNPNNERYQECYDEIYTIKHFASGIMPGQLATIMSRNFLDNPNFDRKLIDMKINPGDKRIVFSLINYGPIYCIQKQMSAYRHVLKGGSSFSANRKYNYETELTLAKAYLSFAKDDISRKYAEFLVMLAIQSGLKNKAIELNKAIADSCVISHKARAFTMLLKRNVNKTIFHKYVYF